MSNNKLSSESLSERWGGGVNQNYDRGRGGDVLVSNVENILDPFNRGLNPDLQAQCQIRALRMNNMAEPLNGRGSFVVTPQELYDPDWVNHMFAGTERTAVPLLLPLGPTTLAPIEAYVDAVAQMFGPESKHLRWNPYIESQQLGLALQKRGMTFVNSPVEVIANGATEFYGDKGNMHVIGEKSKDPTTVKYVLVDGLQNAWGFVKEAINLENGVMVRARMGGGGFNNFLVRLEDGVINVKSATGNFKLESLKELFVLFEEFVDNSPENSHLVINPALRVKESPSVRVVLTDKGVEFKGKYHQLFDANGECIGGDNIIGDELEAKENKILCRALLPTALRLWKAGLRGSKGIDTMRVDRSEGGKMMFPEKLIRYPDGDIVAVAEVNNRWTSNALHEKTVDQSFRARGYHGPYSFAVQEVVPVPSLPIGSFEEAVRDLVERDEVLRFTNQPYGGNIGVSVGVRGTGIVSGSRALELRGKVVERVSALLPREL